MGAWSMPRWSASAPNRMPIVSVKPILGEVAGKPRRRSLANASKAYRFLAFLPKQKQ